MKLTYQGKNYCYICIWSFFLNKSKPSFFFLILIFHSGESSPALKLLLTHCSQLEPRRLRVFGHGGPPAGNLRVPAGDPVEASSAPQAASCCQHTAALPTAATEPPEAREATAARGRLWPVSTRGGGSLTGWQLPPVKNSPQWVPENYTCPPQARQLFTRFQLEVN